jgi:hypothetical protein
MCLRELCSPYVKQIREKKVDFGYIHSVNIEKNIRDIYREVVVSK